MAHDTPLPSDDLRADTRAKLFAALQRFADDGVDGTELRAALCHAADEARQMGMRPERLLVLLKQVWGELPAVRDAKSPREKTALLQQLVTICIKAYYEA